VQTFTGHCPDLLSVTLYLDIMYLYMVVQNASVVLSFLRILNE